MKAYCTRVGEGPFPTELHGEEGDRLRETGGEYGATTGRPRRCGWYDAIAGKYTVEINGVDRIALTKLDVLDGVDPIQVCTGYRYKGKRMGRFPSEARVLQDVEPIYESFPGWKGPTSDRTRFEDLPDEARSYISFLEGKLGVPVSMISIGRRRDQVIIR
jgi:adenylosuccinate synthase